MILPMNRFGGTFSRKDSAVKTLRSWLRTFTLIEMLVVIAIIGILAGMLLPALQTAREEAKKANCKSNLHQIHAAIYMYHDDNGGFYPYHSPKDGSAEPGGHTATDSLALLYSQYIETVQSFRCPSTGDNPKIVTWTETSSDGTPFVRSKRFGEGIGTNFTRTEAYQCSYGYDDQIGLKNMKGLRPLLADMDGTSVTDPDSATANHKGGQNVLYCIGSVSWSSVNTWDNHGQADNYYDNDLGGGDTDAWLSRDTDTLASNP